METILLETGRFGVKKGKHCIAFPVELFIVKLLYMHLGTLVLVNRLKQLTHWAVVKQMMHVLSHTDIFS